MASREAAAGMGDLGVGAAAADRAMWTILRASLTDRDILFPRRGSGA
jgi:hypothetical protein